MIGPNEARITYAELVSPNLLHVEAQPVSKLKDATLFRVMDRPVQRIDITGNALIPTARLHALVAHRVQQRCEIRTIDHLFPACVDSFTPDVALDARPGLDLLRGRPQDQMTLEPVHEIQGAVELMREAADRVIEHLGLALALRRRMEGAGGARRGYG